MIIFMVQRGHFAGNFVATTDDITFSLGDYIEAELLAPPWDTGTVERPHGKKIFAFPLRIAFSCCPDSFYGELRQCENIIRKCFEENLEIDRLCSIVPIFRKTANLSYYEPVIKNLHVCDPC